MNSIQKIKEYKIVSEYISSLAGTVNDLIKEGWRPWGAPVFESHNRFVQAMIKYEEKDESQ